MNERKEKIQKIFKEFLMKGKKLEKGRKENSTRGFVEGIFFLT